MLPEEWQLSVFLFDDIALLTYNEHSVIILEGRNKRMNIQNYKFIPITDLDIPELQIYNERKEVQLLRYYEPAPGLFIAESPNVILRALAAGYEPLSLLMEQREAESGKGREILQRISQILAERYCDTTEEPPVFPVYVSTNEVLSQITGFKLARGVLCAMRRRALPKPEDLCRAARRIAILENVVNPANVGAIFRSAAALGIDAILLTKGCSDPLYRRAARVGMGTVFQVPWTFLREDDWPDDTMKQLHDMGYRTAAMALKEDSLPPDAAELHRIDKLAIILGTEGEGLAADTIADCDYTVCIPMAHGVDSLNVAAASAVAFWELCK